MPVYNYGCKECNHSWEDTFSVNERETPYSQPCPQCQKTGGISIQLGQTRCIDAHRLGRLKPRSDFTERMSQIKKGIPHNKINI